MIQKSVLHVVGCFQWAWLSWKIERSLESVTPVFRSHQSPNAASPVRKKKKKRGKCILHAHGSPVQRGNQSTGEGGSWVNDGRQTADNETGDGSRHRWRSPLVLLL